MAGADPVNAPRVAAAMEPLNALRRITNLTDGFSDPDRVRQMAPEIIRHYREVQQTDPATYERLLQIRLPKSAARILSEVARAQTPRQVAPTQEMQLERVQEGGNVLNDFLAAPGPRQNGAARTGLSDAEVARSTFSTRAPAGPSQQEQSLTLPAISPAAAPVREAVQADPALSGAGSGGNWCG